MEYADLSLRLPEKLSPQAESLWLRFCESGSSDPSRFLAWLHSHGHLSSQEFQDMLSGQEIEIIEFDETETFLQTRGFSFPDEDGAQPDASNLKTSGTGSLRPHYELLSELGKGAMGLVHLAKDHDLQRKVAYKQLLTQSNRSALARFLREAQITAQLDHPHIVPIYGMEVQDDGNLAYSMKLVQGKTFKELINETKAFYDRGETPDSLHAMPRLLEDFLKSCDAVAYAHSKGVIHRDLKPANIMVGRYNEVYVMDWGIARVMQRRDDMPEGWVELGAPEGDDTLEERTRAGQILGTPRYMSPQQAAGRNDELDGRSDLFAMGLILYELLTLRPAFTANNHIDLLKKVLKADKEPWSPYHPSRKIPSELIAVVDKATAQKAPHRYAGVAELAEEIRRYLRGVEVLVRPDNAWRKLARWVGSHREISLLVLLGVLFLSGGAVIWSLVEQQRAMIEAGEHETRLVQLYTHVSQHGQTLDSYFRQMESLVNGLAATATYTLTEGLPSSDPMYFNDAQQPTGKRFLAPDQIPSLNYGDTISPVWPIYVISPGVDPASIDRKLRQLSTMRDYLKQVLMDSHTGGGPPVPKAQWDALLAEKGVPVLWSYVGLKEGVLFFYPGHDEPTVDYDVRVRPYYEQSRGKYEKVWGVPYHDPVGGRIIACTQGIFDKQQNFLGTVGIDIRLNYLRENYLKLTSEPSITETFLLNGEGKVLMRSKASLHNRPLKLNESEPIMPYAVAGVRKAVLAKSPGGRINLSETDPYDNRLVVYTRLNTLGWYYVVEANKDNIFAQPAARQERKP